MQQGCSDDGESGQPIGTKLQLEELPRQANQQRNSAGQQGQIEWQGIMGANAPNIAQKQVDSDGGTSEQSDRAIFSVFFQPGIGGSSWAACIGFCVRFQNFVIRLPEPALYGLL